MTGSIEPGRYAQDASGAWHRIADGEQPPFKPAAMVTVRAAKAIPAPFAAAFEKHDRMIAAKRAAEAEALRTATPGDVLRAIGEEFGILPAMGISRARFKSMLQSNEDEEAARAYARAIANKMGRE